MTIGETIRKLRRARDITQEDLAELLHITSQAVSRWETDATMPDVTSLIGLSRVFDCSTDDLLGLNNIKKDELIEEYSQIAVRASMNRDEETAIRAWRDALAEFPNDYTVMSDLAHILVFYSDRYIDSNPEKYRSMMKEAQKFYEYIIAHCTDHGIVSGAYRSMYFLLGSLGEYEKAKEYLEHLPDIWSSRQVAQISEGENRHEASIRLASDALDLLEFALRKMIWNKEKGFAADERAEIAGIMESLHKLFYGNVTATIRPDFFVTLARAYSGVQDAKNTLRCLRRAADMAAEYDAVDYNNGYVYKINTVPFKDEERMMCAMSNSTGDYRDDLAETLTEERWDFVRDTAEFAEILGIITK